MLTTETALWAMLVSHKMLSMHLGLEAYDYRIGRDRCRFAGYVAAALIARKVWEPWEESAGECFGRPRLSETWRRQLPLSLPDTPAVSDIDQRKASNYLDQYMRTWLDARDCDGTKTVVINTAAVWSQTIILLTNDTRCLITRAFAACAKANAGQLQERLCQIRHTPQQRRRLQ